MALASAATVSSGGEDLFGAEQVIWPLICGVELQDVEMLLDLDEMGDNFTGRFTDADGHSSCS